MAKDLEARVRFRSQQVGERHRHTLKAQRGGPAELEQAGDWVEKELAAAGLTIERQAYTGKGPNDKFCNIQAERNYDSIPLTPGADDNASEVALLIELAKRLQPCARTVRFVAFTNEDPYYFQSEEMGSLVYARRCRERKENIAAMVSLETLGYFKASGSSVTVPAYRLMQDSQIANKLWMIYERSRFTGSSEACRQRKREVVLRAAG